MNAGSSSHGSRGIIVDNQPMKPTALHRNKFSELATARRCARVRPALRKFHFPLAYQAVVILW